MSAKAETNHHLVPNRQAWVEHNLDYGCDQDLNLWQTVSDDHCMNLVSQKTGNNWDEIVVRLGSRRKISLFWWVLLSHDGDHWVADARMLSPSSGIHPELVPVLGVHFEYFEL